MNTVLWELKKLQEVDDQITQDKSLLEENLRLIADMNKKLQNSVEKLTNLKGEYEKINLHQRELEGIIKDLSLKKKNNETRQLSVKNEVEYAALLKEADFFKENINQAEDEALELIDQMENFEIKIEQKSSSLDEEKKLCQQFSEEKNSQNENANSRLLLFLKKRETLTSSISLPFIKQYEELLIKRAGRAVAAAKDGLCLACRLSFPPQLQNELQRNEKVLNCPNCARIIFWQDHPDFSPKEQEGTAPPKD